MASKQQRVLVVTNRLPFSAKRDGNVWSVEKSGGGLASLLRGVKHVDMTWIGWAGVDVPQETDRQDLTNQFASKGCVPVFLGKDIVEEYYNGYSNSILWPLLHYRELPQDANLESQFNTYKRANQMFADVVYQHYKPGDLVWSHDYHLMWLPICMKEKDINIKVGWFLHTPFPSNEMFRMLPHRTELLRSLLYADLVGAHFMSTCEELLQVKSSHNGLEHQGKLTRVAAFAVGIDSTKFEEALELPEVKEIVENLRTSFAGKQVVLGVDRLDMIKGIPQKILAFEKFLQENPDFANKVVLLQIAVPTRNDVPEYKKLTNQVHETVGRINGRYGTFSALPIHHLDKSIDFNTLCALYAVSDVALITSLRDGMNLVSHEYIACQSSKKGVLILSEFVGAAESLKAGSLLVNPWDTAEVAHSILQALKMTSDERENRHRHNYARVTSHTADDWAKHFLRELTDIVVEAQMLTSSSSSQID